MSGEVDSPPAPPVTPVAARSLVYTLPLVRALRRGQLVLVEVTYARTGGVREVFLVDCLSEWKHVLDGLPPRALVRWRAVDYPDFTAGPAAVVADRDGVVRPGAY